MMTETGKNKILDVMKRRGFKEDLKIDEILDKLSKESPITETVKGEFVCELDGEIGKLFYSDNTIAFLGEQNKQTISTKDIQIIKKDGRKRILIRTSSGRIYFGPFYRVKRGPVVSSLRSVCKVDSETTSHASASESSSTSISIDSLPGMKDPLLTTLFSTPPSSLPEGTFLDPVAVANNSSGFTDPISNETLPIPLKPIFAVLFSESSPFLQEVHTADGDTELKIGSWVQDPSKAFYSRELNFSKKSKLYSCRVVQSQRLRIHSKTEIYFETSSSMQGIPFSDTFSVETRWRINGPEEGKNVSSTIKIWVDIDFKKDKMSLTAKAAKSKIEKGAYDGTIEFYKNYFRILRKQLTGEEAEPSSEGGTQSGQGGSSSSSISSSSSSSLTLYLVISLVVLVLGCFLLSSMLSSAYYQTNDLEQTLEKLREENSKKMEGILKVDEIANEFHEKYVHLTDSVLKTTNKRWADILIQTKTLILELEKSIRRKAF